MPDERCMRNHSTTSLLPANQLAVQDLDSTDAADEQTAVTAPWPSTGADFIVAPSAE